MFTRFRFLWLVSTLGVSSPVLAQPVMISVAPDGTTPGNASSYGAVISTDGHFAAFTSAATNLATGDTNGSNDVFVRNLQTNVTTRVSVASDGTERTGDSGPAVSISANGNIVVFSSRAPLVADDTNSCTVNEATVNCSDIYVHDRTTGGTTRISVSSAGTQANGESVGPKVSADGRYVVFTSEASNLVTGDTNGVRDVFLHDRVAHTTVRLSVSPTGVQGDAASTAADISADGQVIAFISDATTLLPLNPSPCTRFECAQQGYVYDRTTATLERVRLPQRISAMPVGTTPAVVGLILAANGRLVFTIVREVLDVVHIYGYYSVQDRVTGRVDAVDTQGGGPGVTVSPDGRFYYVGAGMTHLTPWPARMKDRFTDMTLTVPSFAPLFSGDDLHIVGTLYQANSSQVYWQSLDTDEDGMPDYWETRFALNPASPADAALDADSDGRTNVQEFQAGTNPAGTFKRYFAEGAANAFFTTRFALFNPGDQPANVVLEFLGSTGQTRNASRVVPAHTRTTEVLSESSTLQPESDFSTIVESDQPIVIDRTMTWDKTGYGSHAETAIEAPGTTWYLAEGATHGAFDLFYLLQNPGDVDANVTINYLRPAPQTPVVKTYAVKARSRRTIWVDDEGPELAATDVSAKITSDQPILAERAMYYSTPSQPFAAGHEGAAVASPAMSWFLAEGATGSFFDMFVLVANAESTDAQIKVTYLLASGAPVIKTYTVAANSRKTINVDVEDPRLIDTPVSTIVESTNGVPVIVERSMWWPSPNWYEAHLSAGATTTGTKWALADGIVSTTSGAEAETYVLIANTSSTAGNADVTLFFVDGTSQTITVPLPANSRVNVSISQAFASAGDKISVGFGTVIQSDGPQIVVERAMYNNVNGVAWAAGTAALATKLQ